MRSPRLTPGSAPTTIPPTTNSRIVATIGLRSSGPIRMLRRRKTFRYGFVVSSMNPVTARSARLYGIGRNCCTHESMMWSRIRTK